MNQKGNNGNGSRKPHKKTVTTEFLLLFYESYLREREDSKIAASLETTVATIRSWITRFPELKEAKTLAEKRRKGNDTFSGYVYKHLSSEARAIWDEIQFWEDSNSTLEKINTVLSDSSTKVRQEIFIHALIHYGFSLSEACRVTGIGRNVLENWKQNDFEFLQLIEEIEWHKKNFFERALVDLVSCGNPGAVIFVNRTKNADRGYTEKLQLEHTGNGTTGLSVDDLDLSLETRKEILNAIRAKKAGGTREENSMKLLKEAEPIDV